MIKVALFILCFSAYSQSVSFSGVILPNYSSEGKMESLVLSKTARHMNGEIDLNVVSLELYGESPTTMETNQCRYLQFRKKIIGESYFYLKNDTLDLQGEGFEYDQNTKELKIHKNVVIYLNQTIGEEQ